MASVVHVQPLSRIIQWGASSSSSRTRKTQRLKCLNTESEPVVELELNGPGVEEGVFKVSVPSGQKVLRNVILENKLELELNGPGVEEGVFKVSVPSGQKVLRNVILENKLELYGLYGKVMNCGGGGSCGTCIVEILEGGELLSDRTDAEKKYLKKKPESWRLACQTIVGDKSNSGKVVVQRLPQQKKK